MKFFNLGIKYSFKNFGFLSLLWILPSIFLGLCCGPFQIVKFMNLYPQTEIKNFSSIFEILMPMSWLNVLFLVLAICLLAVAFSMVFGLIERQMRSGKFSFKSMLSYVNNDILVVLINMLILVVLYLFVMFLFGSISFLLHLLFSGLSTIPSVLNVIISIVLACGVVLLDSIITELFLINIPNMISNGYSLKEGISSTCQLIGSDFWKLTVAYLLPYVIIIPFVSLLCQTNVLWLANIACTFVQMLFYSSLTMTSFFELSNMPRYDNRKYYNYNK